MGVSVAPAAGRLRCSHRAYSSDRRRPGGTNFNRAKHLMGAGVSGVTLPLGETTWAGDLRLRWLSVVFDL